MLGGASQKHHKTGGGLSRSASLSTRNHHRPGGISTLRLGNNNSNSKNSPLDEEAFLERLQYVDTALEAMPGRTLRTFFAPILALRKKTIMRKHRTALNMENVLAAIRHPEASSPEVVAGKKTITDALNRLAKNVADSGNDLLGGAAMPLDTDKFVAALRDKVEPVSYGPEDVLYFPNESPESMFVYMVLSGNVSVTHFQPILQRPTIAGTTRAHFFQSGKSTVLLCGGGMIIDNPRAVAMGNTTGGGGGLGGLGGADTTSNPGDGASAFGGGGHMHDGASTSQMSSAANVKNLRHAIRSVGQPTLESVRTENYKAPTVFGALESLGLCPFHCATVRAAPATTKQHTLLRGEHVDVLRVRLADVHEALVATALQAAPPPTDSNNNNTSTNDKAAAGDDNQKKQERHHQPKKANNSNPNFRGRTNSAPTLADFIINARSRTVEHYYPQSEVLMRQSWLLQDTPAQTIRHLISHLTSHTYMPGDILACPHGTSPRQLCFLRRGEFYITEPPPEEKRSGSAGAAAGTAGAVGDRSARSRKRVVCNCDARTCGDIYEIIYPGSSFGELSVLFGEPRDYTLIAKTVCDVWVLSYRDFSMAMQRDDALRATLVQKAAALRIKWLAEQRFSAGLTKHLRDSCEMFRPFPDIVMRLIQERIEPVVFSPGELVASTAERCREMIFIIQGKVSSLVRGLATYGPGQVLGGGCLVAHRWPIALSAKTMVEGWRLPRERLLDALARADFLHAHSGERTSMLSTYMRYIFKPPLPELNQGVHTRNQMPIVPAAPGGTSYPEYGIRVSEILLRALCVLFKGFVKWEEINYASMTGGKVGELSNDLARKEVIHSLRETVRPGKVNVKESIGAAFERQKEIINSKSKKSKNRNNNNSNSGADIGSGLGSAAVAAGSGRAAAAAARGGIKTRRKRTTGTCAFLVDEDAADRPFVSTTERRPPLEKRINADYIKSMQHKPLMDSCFSVQDPSCTARLKRMVHIPPKLHQFKRILDERDRMCEMESLGQSLTTTVKPGNNNNSSINNNNNSVAGSSAPGDADELTGSPKFRNRELQQLAQTAQFIIDDRVNNCYQGERQVLGALAPAHLFLLQEKPKAEISIDEAMAIGFVLRLPNSSSIQACVPIVDPDVCIGLPRHRPRRHAMAMTPNDRHSRNNFLFAAARFDDVEGSGDSGSRRRNTNAVENTSSGSPGGSPRSGRSGTDSQHGNERSGSANSAASHTSGGVAGGGLTPAEKERERQKTEILLSILRDNVAQKQKELFQNTTQGLKSMESMGGLRSSPASVEVSPRSSMRDNSARGGLADSRGHSPPTSAAPPAGGEASQTVLSFSAAASPSGVIKTQTVEEERMAAEQHMVNLLLRDPQRALEMLFSRFEDSSAASKTATAAAINSSFLFPVDSLEVGGAGGGNSGGDSGRATPRNTQRGGAAKPAMLERLKTLYQKSKEKGGVQARGAVLEATTNGPAVAGTGLPSFQFAQMSRHGKLVVATTNPTPRTASLASSGVMAEEGSAAHLDGSATAAGEDDRQPPQLPTPLPTGGQPPLSPSAGQRSPIDRYFADTRNTVLFVDGLGALNKGEIAVSGGAEPSSVAASAVLGGLSFFGSSGRRPSASGTIGFNPDVSMLGGLSMSGMDHLVAAEGGAADGAISPGYSLGSMGGGGEGSGVPVLQPSDFVMPSIPEAIEFMERMQRDVDGLNAVAAEQTRERERIRVEQLRRGKAYEAIQEALSKPTDEEREILEAWKREHETTLHDPMQLSSIPTPLLRHAGDNYLNREIEELKQYVAPMTTTNKSVLAWHDQMEAETATGWDALQPNAPSNANNTLSANPTRGGLKKKGGGAMKESAGKTDALAASKRVLAPIGTRQMGCPSQPLHHPGREMREEVYKSWVRQREDFLTNYVQMFEGEEGGTNAAMLDYFSEV